jgi:hypothetical protein
MSCHVPIKFSLTEFTGVYAVYMAHEFAPQELVSHGGSRRGCSVVPHARAVATAVVGAIAASRRKH